MLEKHAPPPNPASTATPSIPRHGSRATIHQAEREAFRRLETLNRWLLSQPSAKLTLERWIKSTWPPQTGQITVDRLTCEPTAAHRARREQLKGDPGEPIRHRRVRLRFGSFVLSEADNWYRPKQLTPEMNQVLDTTDISFGRVVQPLGFRRTTISAELLWRPATEARGSDAAGPLVLPTFVMQHRAVLIASNGTPFSEVLEVYTRHVLDLGQDR